MYDPTRLRVLAVIGILACETTDHVTDRAGMTAGATTAGQTTSDTQRTDTRTDQAANVEADSNQPSSTPEESDPMTSAGIQSREQPTAGERRDPSPMRTNTTAAGSSSEQNEPDGGDPGGHVARPANTNRGGHSIADGGGDSMNAALGGTVPSSAGLQAGQRAEPVGGQFNQDAHGMDPAGANGQTESSGGVVLQGAAGSDQPAQSTGGSGASMNSAGNDQAGPSTGGGDASMNSAGTMPSVGGEMSVDGGGMPDAGPRCDDRERNGTETDVDCGGECERCPKNGRCAVHDDCLTGQCLQGICRETCRGPASCDVGEVCICPSGWGRDADPCNAYGPMDAFCLPCDQFEGPYCGFEGQPEQGQTYARLCDFPGGLNGYLLRGECPAECSVERPCPGACDACQAGRCVSLADESGICPF